MERPPFDLDAFCRSEWPRLVGALSLYTGDPLLAEELSQETLTRAARDWRTVSRLDSPAAWAYRVALNLASSHFRRLRVARRVQAQLSAARVWRRDLDTVDALAVRAAVAALAERPRRALVLRYWLDLSVDEVAALMHCPPNTVKTLTRRAVSRCERRTLSMTNRRPPMSTELHEILELGAPTPAREPDVFAIWKRGRRRRLRRRFAVAAATVIVVVAGTVALRQSIWTHSSAPVHVAAPSEQWTTVRDATHGLAISFPSSWQAAPSTLTPVLVDPIVPLAVGTYPLEPQRLHECDIVPQRALEGLGPSDAFIAIYLYQGSATFDPQLQRPTHFSPELFPAQGIQCTENVHGTVKSLGFVDHGRKISVMIAIGSNATPQRQDEIYRILDTLIVDPPPGS